MTTRQEQLLEAYFADRLSDAEREELISQLDSDAEFATAFSEYEHAYASAYVPVFEKTKEEDFQKLSNLIEHRSRPSMFRKYFSVAAAVSVLLLGSALFLHYNTTSVHIQRDQLQAMTITANNGTGTEAILPDGTHVRLNAESTLRLDGDFGLEFRDVILDGEGFFEVTSDPSKPFRVHSSNACVTVKGTIFNVRNYCDEPEITVSLLEGSVVLNTDSREAALTPGHCAMIARGDDDIRIADADPSVAAWTSGKYVFADKTIPDILRSVERNYDVHFIYDADLFVAERFTGVISYYLSIDEILSCLDVDRKYSWRRSDNVIEIFKK